MAVKKTTAKKEPAKKPVTKKEIELDPKKIYKFVASKDSKHLKKGDVYTMNGSMAKLLISKGLGSVKA